MPEYKTKETPIDTKPYIVYTDDKNIVYSGDPDSDIPGGGGGGGAELIYHEVVTDIEITSEKNIIKTIKLDAAKERICDHENIYVISGEEFGDGKFLISIAHENSPRLMLINDPNTSSKVGTYASTLYMRGGSVVKAEGTSANGVYVSNINFADGGYDVEITGVLPANVPSITGFTIDIYRIPAPVLLRPVTRL